MQRELLRVGLHSAWNTKRMAVLYVLLDLVAVLSIFACTLFIAMFFGHDIAGVGKVAGTWVADPNQLWLISSSVCALVGCVARLGSAATIAKITVKQEFWYAGRVRRLRKDEHAKLVARASNHYGRLTAAAVRMVSAVTVLITTLLALFAVVEFAWQIVIFLTLMCSVAVAYLVLGPLANKLSESSRNLVLHARHTTLWKAGSVQGTGPLRLYSSAYFNRMFLPGLFGLAPMIFGLIVSVLLWFTYELQIQVDLSVAFISFVLAQSYLGIVGRFFSDATSIAAFLPAVRQVWMPSHGLDTL